MTTRLALLLALLAGCGDDLAAVDATVGTYAPTWSCESAVCEPDRITYLTDRVIEEGGATFAAALGGKWTGRADLAGACVELPDGVPLVELVLVDPNALALEQVGASDPALLCLDGDRLRGLVVAGEQEWALEGVDVPRWQP